MAYLLKPIAQCGAQAVNDPLSCRSLWWPFIFQAKGATSNNIWPLDALLLNCRETKTNQFPAGPSLNDFHLQSLNLVNAAFRQVVVGFPTVLVEEQR